MVVVAPSHDVPQRSESSSDEHEVQRRSESSTTFHERVEEIFFIKGVIALSAVWGHPVLPSEDQLSNRYAPAISPGAVTGHIAIVTSSRSQNCNGTAVALLWRCCCHGAATAPGGRRGLSQHNLATPQNRHKSRLHHGTTRVPSRRHGGIL
jgi:hypothetical protein